MSEEKDNTVALVDENGEEMQFEHLDTIEMNDNQYVVLLPMEEQDEEEKDEDEVVILKIEQSDNGEDAFVGIEDEDELNSVFEEFKYRMEEEFEFVE